MSLAEQECMPISPEVETITQNEALELEKEIPEWYLGHKMLRREFTFDNFEQALGFLNQVSAIAKKQNHHPNICLFYNRVEVVLTTHKIGGLTMNDFIMAAKIDLIACTPERLAMHA